MSSWQSRLRRFVTDYEVTPIVIIRSPWLRIPELIIFSLLMASFMVWALLYQLKGFDSVEVEMAPLIELYPPQKNFWDCSSKAGNCEPDYPEPNTTYYCKDYEPGPDRLPCLVLHASALTENRAPTSDIAVALSETSFWERECHKLKGSARENCRGWAPDTTSVRRAYVDGAESALVMIRNFIQTQSLSWSTTGSSVQSLLKFKGTGEVKRLVAYGSGQKEDLEIPNREYFAATHPESCGKNTGGQGTCMGTPWGDYISLSVLLEAANITTIDDDMRKKGFILQVTCRYSNMDLEDFWSWPFGFKEKVVYEPSVGEYAKVDTMEFKEVESHANGDAYITIKEALLVKSAAKGVHGHFSAVVFVTRFVIALTLLAYARFFVNTVLVKLYSWSDGLKHIHLLFELSSRKATKHSDEFQGHDIEKMMESLAGGGITTTLEGQFTTTLGGQYRGLGFRGATVAPSHGG